MGYTKRKKSPELYRSPTHGEGESEKRERLSFDETRERLSFDETRRDETEDIICPYCAASGDEPCITASGDPAENMHASRAELLAEK